MKLRKQAGAKALVVTLTAALVGAFFALVRADPRVEAEAVPTATPVPVDYNRFFTPNQPVAGDPRPTPAGPPSPPHTRTRAS